ncbi:MAG: hypothetical protein IPM34_10330 [Saprospiraceae bacterium]|nr:hypothetical protein [Saprospiraceae bacterium]
MEVQINIYNQLENIVKSISQHHDPDVYNDIMDLYNECSIETDRCSEKLLATIVLHALRNRIRPGAIDENIYEKAYEMPQIQLFNILIEQFPFVKFSQQITNTAIANLIRNESEATIIDIGVGQGTQIINILELLKDSKQLKKLVIVGIEPFENALQIAKNRINELGRSLPFSVEFIDRQQYVELIDFSAMKQLPGKIVVNASLALHHIQSSKQRLDTIKSIRQLNPAAFFIDRAKCRSFRTGFVKEVPPML